MVLRMGLVGTDGYTDSVCHKDKSGSLSMMVPPGTPAPEVSKPAYFFNLDDRQVPAVQACGHYRYLLEQLEAAYKCST